MVLTQTKSIFVAALMSALITVGCSQNKSNSNSSANINFGYEKTSSQFDSKVCGSMPEVKYNGEEPESFMLSQPLPEIWIVERTDNQNTELNCDQAKIKLSGAARKLLEKQWTDRNEFNCSRFIFEVAPGREDLKGDTKSLESTAETEIQLMTTPVSDEKNVRNITSREADEMIWLIGRWSLDLTKAVKKSNN